MSSAPPSALARCLRFFSRPAGPVAPARHRRPEPGPERSARYHHSLPENSVDRCASLRPSFCSMHGTTAVLGWVPLICCTTLQILSCNTFWSISIMHFGPTLTLSTLWGARDHTAVLRVTAGVVARLRCVFRWRKRKAAGQRANLNQSDSHWCCTFFRNVVLRLSPLNSEVIWRHSTHNIWWETGVLAQARSCVFIALRTGALHYYCPFKTYQARGKRFKKIGDCRINDHAQQPRVCMIPLSDTGI